jgi:radical SAM protein
MRGQLLLAGPIMNRAGPAEGPGLTRSFDDRPLLVFWETTKACLLACSHCRANAQRDPGSDDLSTAEGFALIDDLSAIDRPRPVMILTGGDCLMRNDIVAVVTYAKQMNVPVAIAPSVTPKLTSTTLRQMRAQNVKTASLSLDGATADTHEAVRGINGHFDATIRAIDQLKMHGYTVQINTTVMRRNVGELADIATLMHRFGVNVWEVFFLIATGRGTGIEATSVGENEDICHFLVDASQYGFTVRTVEAPFFRRVVADRRRIGDVRPEDAFDLGPLYLHLRDRLHGQLGSPIASVRAPSAATRDGKGIIFVANNGDVYPSGFLPLRLGNIREQSIVEIYRDHPLLHSIRNADFAGRCGICEHADLCGGSRAQAYARSSDPLGEDPTCAYEPPPQVGVVGHPSSRRGA